LAEAILADPLRQAGL